MGFGGKFCYGVTIYNERAKEAGGLSYKTVHVLKKIGVDNYKIET